MLSSSEIEVVLFDLDGTLRHNRPSANEAFLDRARELGVKVSASQRWQAFRWAHYYWAQSTELQADMAVYGDDEAQFWTNYARRNLEVLECQPTCAQELAPMMFQFMREIYQAEDWVPPEVWEALDILHSEGYRLAVLSNRAKPFGDLMQSLGLAKYFEFALAAGEIAVWKPEPEIFHHAVDKIGVALDAVVYIGDNYYADIIGAQRAGLPSILIDPEGLFPEATCPVIRNMGELPAMLNHP